jgi:hypothetical protein
MFKHDDNRYIKSPGEKKECPLRGEEKPTRSLFKRLSKFSLDTKWYLSLAHLESNQLELAKELLSEISDISGYKPAEAEMILL